MIFCNGRIAIDLKRARGNPVSFDPRDHQMTAADKLRLKEPVPAGSRLRICGEIKSVRMMANGAARTTLALRWEVEGARRSVCTAHVIYVFYP